MFMPRAYFFLQRLLDAALIFSVYGVFLVWSDGIRRSFYCACLHRTYHGGPRNQDAERLPAPMQKITDYLLNSFANDIQFLSTDDK